jgi:hypothetical protein
LHGALEGLESGKVPIRALHLGGSQTRGRREGLVSGAGILAGARARRRGCRRSEMIGKGFDCARLSHLALSRSTRDPPPSRLLEYIPIAVPGEPKLGGRTPISRSPRPGRPTFVRPRNRCGANLKQAVLEMRCRFVSQGTLQIEQRARQRSMRASVLSFQFFHQCEGLAIMSYRFNGSAFETGIIAHLLFFPESMSPGLTPGLGDSRLTLLLKLPSRPDPASDHLETCQ